jgi:hypothetical protein
MSSERKTLKSFFFHARLTGTRQLVTFGELSNNVDSTGTGSIVLWLGELRSLMAVQRLFRRNMDVNLVHGKSFGSGTTD